VEFLGIGPVELLVVALVAFMILGPTRMAEMARSLGKLVQELRRTTSDLPSLLAPDEPLDQPPKDNSANRPQRSTSNPEEEKASDR